MEMVDEVAVVAVFVEFGSVGGSCCLFVECEFAASI